MLFERNVAILAGHVFEPRETIRMSRLAGDDIVSAITVHIEGVHLGAAAFGELHRMKRPELSFRASRWMFPPTVFLQQVQSAVAINISDSHAVRKPLVAALRCDGMKLPL